MQNRISRVHEFINEFWNKKTRDSDLFDLFTENLIYRNISGRRLGRESYQNNSADWDHTFPDYQMKIEKVEPIENTLIVTYDCQGSYVNPFVDHKKNILDTSEFNNLIHNAKPGAVHRSKVEWTFLFKNNKVVRLYCHSDEKDFYRQLGIYDSYPQDISVEKDKKTLSKKLQNIYFTPLSAREIECLAFTFTGFSAKSIAQILTISYRTVETHLQKAYQKLKCFGKQQCLEMMHENQSLPIWQEYCQVLLGAKNHVQL